jgi:hypothetical protein
VNYEPQHPIRVAIVLDIDDANPDLLYIWISARAARLVEELQQKGINTDLVRVDMDGYPHLSC